MSKLEESRMLVFSAAFSQTSASTFFYSVINFDFLFLSQDEFVWKKNIWNVCIALYVYMIELPCATVGRVC